MSNFVTLSDRDPHQLHWEVSNFLHHEANLLDERRFQEWLDLLTEDVHYFMPLSRNVKHGEHAEKEHTKAGRDVNWFDEGKWTLTKRLEQIQTGVHWAEEPLSRSAHLLTNILVQEVKGDEVAVSSKFLMYRNRDDRESDILVGSRRDTLRLVDGKLKLARRAIYLAQNVLLAKNLTVLF